MANQSKKPASKGSGRNDNRASGKAAKKHPQPTGKGRTGRTVGGYTPEKIAARAFKRMHGHADLTAPVSDDQSV